MVYDNITVLWVVWFTVCCFIVFYVYSRGPSIAQWFVCDSTVCDSTVYTLNLQWNYNETTMKLQYNYNGTTMKLQWNYNETTMKLQW